MQGYRSRTIEGYKTLKSEGVVGAQSVSVTHDSLENIFGRNVEGVEPLRQKYGPLRHL